jgi:hypothetical protein
MAGQNGHDGTRPFDEGHVLDGQQGATPRMDASAFRLPERYSPKTAKHQSARRVRISAAVSLAAHSIVLATICGRGRCGI